MVVLEKSRFSWSAKKEFVIQKKSGNHVTAGSSALSRVTIKDVYSLKNACATLD